MDILNKTCIAIFIFVLITGCNPTDNRHSSDAILPVSQDTQSTASLIILGTIQDAGSPHIACNKNCCKNLFIQPDISRKVTALGIVDSKNKKTYLIEASPDMPAQLKTLKASAPFAAKEIPDAIFLTHAHIGHYTGLMYLGREAMNANHSPIYTMPLMKNYLTHNGPWSQLVSLKNIELLELQNLQSVALDSTIKITPVLVPHRDEFSETVGYIIMGPSKKILFIPDIDKWEKWNFDIIAFIGSVDIALIDGTFYDAAEINNRNISEIPHPLIIESMEKFQDLPPSEKNKIYFIHFNHTNPVLNPNNGAVQTIQKNGFHIAKINMKFEL